MTSLITVLCLHSAMVGVNVDLKLDADLQLRGDYSHTPFISGPDAAPLLNAAGSSLTSQQGTFDVEIIFTPAGLLTVKGQDFSVQFGYAPRLFIDTFGFSRGQGVQLFHRLNLDITLGRASEALVSLGAQASLGGIDYTQAGQVLTEFSGSTKPGASSTALNFFTLSGYAKLEKPIGRNFKFTTTETVTKFDSASTSTGDFLAANPTNSAGVQALSGTGAAPTLQSMDSVSSKNELSYKVNDAHSLRIDALFAVTSFPATQTFIGITPTVGWTYILSKNTRIDANLGFMKYWTNPYPGIFNTPQYMVVGDLAVSHKFADFGLPKLTGTLSIGEAPYYDIIFGDMDRRGSISGQLTYDFTRQIQGSVQVRDYTEEYFDGRHWIPVPKNRDLNVAILSLQLKYKYSSWLSYTGGLYGLNEQVQPSATTPYKTLQDAYIFLGVTGSYDVE